MEEAAALAAMDEFRVESTFIMKAIEITRRNGNLGFSGLDMSQKCSKDLQSG